MPGPRRVLYFLVQCIYHEVQRREILVYLVTVESRYSPQTYTCGRNYYGFAVIMRTDSRKRFYIGITITLIIKRQNEEGKPRLSRGLVVN